MSALRRLPSVDSILRDERLAGLPRELCVAAVRQVLDRARETIRRGGDPPDDLAAAALAELESARAPSLRRVLNATGVVVHTNLGRAPLSSAALDRVLATAGGYSNLELDLASGKRGSRQSHLTALLGEVLPAL